MLEQIPFLPNCEDEDSDEDDELDSVQHKKQRVKVSAWPRGRAPPFLQGSPPALCPAAGCPWDNLCGLRVAWPHPRVLVSLSQ